jgi:hypothetical protein
VSTSDDIIGSDAVLSELEQAGLARILRAMIPASEAYGVPGADDPLIVADIIATGRVVLPELAPLLKSLGETALAISGAEPDTEALSLRQEHPEIAAGRPCRSVLLPGRPGNGLAGHASQTAISRWLRNR